MHRRNGMLWHSMYKNPSVTNLFSQKTKQMLDYSLKGTYQDESGYQWDYYRDDRLGPDPDPNQFYIIPRPQYALDANGDPIIQIHTYKTDDASNGSGFCRVETILSVPANIQRNISAAILKNTSKFPGVKKPIFASLSLNPGSTATAIFQSEQSPLAFTVNASDFGSNAAVFLMTLNKTQIASLKSILSTKGGGLDITYKLSVPARLHSVTAVLTFNAAIAYKYQVTEAKYNSWGDKVSPRTAKGLLTDSESSHVKLTWGISDPPSSLVKSVTDWANDTLADLVTAEVKKVLAVQKITSKHTFTINEVQSFKSTFSENSVVNWLIYPKSVLPSFTDLGLEISKFESTIDTRQQQMIVSTNVPFNESSAPHLEQILSGSGISKQSLVKSISVTVHYPTLAEGASQFTFTKNESKTFLSKYDENQGPVWKLDYQVDYLDTSIPSISGSIENIDDNQEYIKLQEIGILVVQFDASQAFNSEFTQPDKIEVNFSYINPLEKSSKPVAQVISFSKSDKSFLKSVSSLQPLPVTSSYNYQLTYIYQGVNYQAPLVQNQTDFHQIIHPVNRVQQTPLIFYVPAPDTKGDYILNIAAKVWYEKSAKLPKGITTQPTQDDPAEYIIAFSTLKNGDVYGTKTFDGVQLASSPMLYSAAITSTKGQIEIPPQKLSQELPSIFVGNTQRYYTLEISAFLIDWKTASYAVVQVLSTITVKSNGKIVNTYSSGDTGTQWNKNEHSKKYHTISYQDGQEVTYDLEIQYWERGKAAIVKNKKNLSTPLYAIPNDPNDV